MGMDNYIGSVGSGNCSEFLKGHLQGPPLRAFLYITMGEIQFGVKGDNTTINNGRRLQ
jgi:hypothetical protein